MSQIFCHTTFYLIKTKIFFIICLFLFFFSCSNKKKQEFSYHLIPVEISGKWGYIDVNGNCLIEPHFQMAYLFSDELAVVRDENGKMGYINQEGNYIIPPIFLYASNFSEGVAFVTPEDHVPACIDKKGKTLFQLYDADMVHVFSEGLALIQIGEKYGYIDKTGQLVITPQFDKASNFSEGLAAVGVESGTNFKIIKWGFIDKTGKFIISPRYDSANDFKERKAFVKEPSHGKWGVINQQGNYLINPQFDDAEFFSEELAAVKLGDSWGFINAKGRFIINPQFNVALPFHEKVSVVNTFQNQWNLINDEGKILTKAFTSISCFFNHHAFAVQDGKIGLINKHGDFIIQPSFSNAFPYYIANNAIFLNTPIFNDVISDFFNTLLTADVFLEESMDSVFRNMSAQTTYNDLINSSTYRNLTEISRYSLMGKYPIEIMKDLAFIGAVNFEFQTPIFRIEPTYYYGHKIGENQISEIDAQIEAVEYTIYLGTAKKVQGKESMLCNALKNAIYQRFKILQTKYFLLESETILTSKWLQFTIKCNKENIILTVEFLTENTDSEKT